MRCFNVNYPDAVVKGFTVRYERANNASGGVQIKIAGEVVNSLNS